MRTDRSYRKALAHQVALAELQNNAGTQFDPTVVAVLVAVVEPGGAHEPASAARPDRLGFLTRRTHRTTAKLGDSGR
jgi:HD-GYP domain-containing protein (c-di-GMP phosphodiesterase class II)